MQSYIFYPSHRKHSIPDLPPSDARQTEKNGLLLSTGTTPTGDFFDNLWGIPENSLSAFKAAVDKGYGIELDVHLTADNELVVHHDDSLYRMCHIERDIKDMTLKEIRQYVLFKYRRKDSHPSGGSETGGRQSSASD